MHSIAFLFQGNGAHVHTHALKRKLQSHFRFCQTKECLVVRLWVSFYMPTTLRVNSFGRRCESVLQWCLKCTELCPLITVDCLSANELKQSTDLSCSIIFFASVFLSVSKSLSILSTSLDPSGLPTDQLLTIGPWTNPRPQSQESKPNPIHDLFAFLNTIFNLLFRALIPSLNYFIYVSLFS